MNMTGLQALISIFMTSWFTKLIETDDDTMNTNTNFTVSNKDDFASDIAQAGDFTNVFRFEMIKANRTLCLAEYISKLTSDRFIHIEVTIINSSK